MIRLPWTAPVAPAVLTTELRQAVRVVVGITVYPASVLIDTTRPLSALETQQLAQVLAVHDAVAVQAARDAKHAAAKTEQAKDPKNLNLDERVTRLETILSAKGWS